MPSLNLTPSMAARVICLPGTALIKCSPAELMTESGMLYKPEAAASWEREQQAVRMGVIMHVRYDRKTKPSQKELEKGLTVYYLGRQDEANDDYVVVKLGQIVAVLE